MTPRAWTHPGIRHDGAPVFRMRRSTPEFSRDEIAGTPLRRRVCECVTIPRAQPGVAPRVDGSRRNLEAPGILFCSNPRGNNEEGVNGDRYGCFFDLTTWRDYVTAAGFTEVRHYYRPPGLPRNKQWWLATVWRKRLLER